MRRKNVMLLDLFCSVRKNADGLKQSLDKVVVPIFCTTSIGVDEEKGQKLAKVRALCLNCLNSPAHVTLR